MPNRRQAFILEALERLDHWLDHVPHYVFSERKFYRDLGCLYVGPVWIKLYERWSPRD